jgi:hypothetical protein
LSPGTPDPRFEPGPYWLAFFDALAAARSSEIEVTALLASLDALDLPAPARVMVWDAERVSWAWDLPMCWDASDAKGLPAAAWDRIGHLVGSARMIWEHHPLRAAWPAATRWTIPAGADPLVVDVPARLPGLRQFVASNHDAIDAAFRGGAHTLPLTHVRYLAASGQADWLAALLCAPAARSLIQLDLGYGSLPTDLHALSRAELPELRDLRLPKAYLHRDAIRAIARSGWWPRLHTLELVDTNVPVDDSGALLDAIEASSLQTLDLLGVFGGEAIDKVLSRLPPTATCVRFSAATDTTPDPPRSANWTHRAHDAAGIEFQSRSNPTPAAPREWCPLDSRRWPG